MMVLVVLEDALKLSIRAEDDGYYWHGVGLLGFIQCYYSFNPIFLSSSTWAFPRVKIISNRNHSIILLGQGILLRSL